MISEIKLFYKIPIFCCVRSTERLLGFYGHTHESFYVREQIRYVLGAGHTRVPKRRLTKVYVVSSPQYVVSHPDG